MAFTSLLSVPCYGVECSSATIDAAPDVPHLGVAYARLVLRAISVVCESERRTARALVRLGGYSYGCRIAYAAAQHLEEAGCVDHRARSAQHTTRAGPDQPN